MKCYVQKSTGKYHTLGIRIMGKYATQKAAKEFRRNAIQNLKKCHTLGKRKSEKMPCLRPEEIREKMPCFRPEEIREKMPCYRPEEFGEKCHSIGRREFGKMPCCRPEGIRGKMPCYRPEEHQ